MAKIDIHTVEKLQLRAPAACPADAREVKGYILSGEVFSQFGETERPGIWNRITRYDGIVPLIHTFFRDTTRGTCLVQISEAGFRSHTGPSTDSFELAYR